MRRLPIFILVDTSESMRGEPIESVKNGLQMLVAALRRDPQALETAYLSIITFGGAPRQIMPLTGLDGFCLPELDAGGNRRLGAALELLCECRLCEVVPSTSAVKGDWLPFLFILTDGEPDDDVSIGIMKCRSMYWGGAVSCAAGPKANKELLNKITPDCVVELASADQTTLTSLFTWKSEQEIQISKTRESLPPALALHPRIWDGRYYQCQGCAEIFTFSLRTCPCCGAVCNEVRLK